MKSQVVRYNWSLASHNIRYSMVVRARCAGLLYFWNLSCFPVSDYVKNVEYTEIYWSTCVPKIVITDEVLEKLLQK